MIEILKSISSIPTAPGFEQELLSYIEEAYADFSPVYDGMGNLILSKKCGKENAKKVMLAAGCDDAGFIVSYIEENGYLRVTALGMASIASAAYTRVLVNGRVGGFVVGEKNAELKGGDCSKIYIDIGAKSREEAEKSVKLGDICCLAPQMTELCGGRIGGLGLSSRIGAAIMLDVLKNAPSADCDLYLSFAVQDNLRHRGAKAAAFDINPDFCICIDTCESFDTLGANKRGEAVLGDGAVILAKTGDYCANPELREKAENAARNANITHKTCVYAEKTTTASLISRSGTGAVCIVLAVPVRNAGSGAEVLDINDANSTRQLAASLIEALEKQQLQ